MTKIPDNIKQINTLLTKTIPETVLKNSLKANSAVAGVVPYQIKQVFPSVDLAFSSNLLSSDLEVLELHPWNIGEYGIGKYSQQLQGFLGVATAINVAKNKIKSTNNVAIIATSVELNSFLALLKLIENVFKLPKLKFLIKRVEKLIILDSEKMNLSQSSGSNHINTVNKNLSKFVPFDDFYQTAENLRNLMTFNDCEPTSELATFITERNTKLVQLQQHFSELSLALNLGQIRIVKLSDNSNNNLETKELEKLANNYTYLAAFGGNIELITFLEEFFQK